MKSYKPSSLTRKVKSMILVPVLGKMISDNLMRRLGPLLDLILLLILNDRVQAWSYLRATRVFHRTTFLICFTVVISKFTQSLNK
jgi:hypothetical protein